MTRLGLASRRPPPRRFEDERPAHVDDPYRRCDLGRSASGADSCAPTGTTANFFRDGQQRPMSDEPIEAFLAQLGLSSEDEAKAGGILEREGLTNPRERNIASAKTELARQAIARNLRRLCRNSVSTPSTAASRSSPPSRLPGRRYRAALPRARPRIWTTPGMSSESSRTWPARPRSQSTGTNS